MPNDDQTTEGAAPESQRDSQQRLARRSTDKSGAPDSERSGRSGVGGVCLWDDLPPKLQNFERAFTSGGGGCRRECECGRQFYTTDTGYDWEEGEFEALEANPEAIAREWSIGTIIFGGAEYVTDCTCWHAAALKCIAWMDHNAHQVAEYLSLEKERKQKEADRSPILRAAGVRSGRENDATPRSRAASPSDVSQTSSSHIEPPKKGTP